MSFTVAQLLLTESKRTELTRALANTGQAQPLEACIAEAVADVARLTTGYIIDPTSQNSWTRILALFKAYSLAGNVPPDIQTQYNNAMNELNSIARGDRKNLPRVPDANNDSPSTGGWGSDCKINTSNL